MLKPGALLIYKTPEVGQWVGTVLLRCCELIERPSKKDGFCFKLFHPLDQSVWAVKVPLGEARGGAVRGTGTAGQSAGGGEGCPCRTGPPASCGPWPSRWSTGCGSGPRGTRGAASHLPGGGGVGPVGGWPLRASTLALPPGAARPRACHSQVARSNPEGPVKAGCPRHIQQVI